MEWVWKDDFEWVWMDSKQIFARASLEIKNIRWICMDFIGS